MKDNSFKPSALEKFGLYYLRLFKKIDKDHSVFDFTDEQLRKKVQQIATKAIVLSSVIGIVCVFPTVWVDVYFEEKPWNIHYGWVALVTLISVVIEFYILFIIALKAVYEVSELINLKSTPEELQQFPAFNLSNILARTALELPDPELQVLGINPFKRMSKKNILMLGLLYKAKIFLSNFLIKNGLKFAAGKTVFGIPILYEALFVEAFWNSVVVNRVIKEARLRLFGFALANKVATDTAEQGIVNGFSMVAKQCCLRAIGNAVVMTKNYHPNMMVLLFKFQQILGIAEVAACDDFEMFLQELNKCTEQERMFIFDLFAVSVAFDGKISDLEMENLRAVFGELQTLYQQRIINLVALLQQGKINAARSLCTLDTVAG